MKKKIIMLLLLFLLLLTSCKFERKIEYELITPKTIYMGNTSLDDFKIKLSNGEEVAVDSSMLDDYSKLSFYKEGNQTFTIIYKNVKKSTTIEVIRNKFTNLKFEDLTTSYTGEAITLSVFGDIPGNANIWYPNGNSFVNPGEYKITAVISLDYYETLELQATLTIVE